MNYEELLESRNGTAMGKDSMPFGQFYKKMVNGKYENVVDLRNDLKDSLLFCDAITADSEHSKKFNHKHQLPFTLTTDSAGIYGVSVGPGSYRTFERLLEDNPAVVAGKGFIRTTIDDLLDITSKLHEQGIFQVCYAPSNMLARKGDNAVMLVFHGSEYKAIKNQEQLYGDCISFIAPEVLEEGVVDARSDIYSIGKFLEYLYQQSEIPLELKGIIKKATAEDPDKRYQTPAEMKKAIGDRQNARRSIISLVAALLITACAVGLYFTLIPEREDIEYVKPAPKTDMEDEFEDDGYYPELDSSATPDSTVGKVDEQQMKVYQAKAEQIFRKQFTRKANEILSDIYNNEHMNSTEKNFRAGSQSTLEELVKSQVELGQQAGLSESRSQLIAGEIIDQISAKLKKQMSDKEKEKEKE